MDFVPSDTPWTLSDLGLSVLDQQPEPGFDCGRVEQNAFLYQRAWRDTKRGVSVTHLLFVKGVLAAFATLMMDRIVLGPTERPRGVSYRYVGAVKIAQLAVDRRFAGHGLGRDLEAIPVSMRFDLRDIRDGE